MRGLLRALAVLALLLAGVAVAAALILPGVVASDAFRERVRVAAQSALGRDVHYGAIAIEWFPPSLVVEEVVVAGEAAALPPLLAGERLELWTSLLPLLATTPVVDSMLLRGARLNLVRTAGGIGIPAPKSLRERVSATGSDDAAAGFDLAIANVELEDVTVVLEDRSMSPAVIWELRGVSARVSGISAEEPVAFDFELELSSGGRISGSGDATLAGVVNVELTLADVALKPARVYVDSGSAFAGRLSGKIVAVGSLANLESLRIDAKLVDGRFELDNIEVVGAVRIVADLHGGAADPRGVFDIDATDAEVRYGGMFTKPPGDAATLQGKLVEAADGSTGTDDVHIKIQNFKATTSLHGRMRRRVLAHASPLESLAGILGVTWSD